MKKSLIVVAHNLRSAHNIGSLMRTCEGLGVDKLFLTGYTPHPSTQQDGRLPHIVHKLDKQITKTSLGAEKSLNWEYREDVQSVLNELSKSDYKLAALEQHPKSTQLDKFKNGGKLALVLGNEVTGIANELIERADIILEIPMAGKKESFNVVEAATMAIYHCKYLA